MSEILRKYNLVSIGYNCSCKKYINLHIESKAIQIFDYIGTSMWSIVDLLKNDFKDLMLMDKIENKLICDGDKPVTSYTNLEYYVRFLHDDLSKEKYDKTLEKNLRRIDRFKEVLNSDKPVIFMRLEEPVKNRIKYDMYDEKFSKSEYEYLIEFSNWIKENKNIEFKIIYINNSNTNYDAEHNILSIRDNTNMYNWNNVNKRINDLMNKNKALIESII